jgi:hypothetical protein
MSEMVLCSRHGLRYIGSASPGVAARIGARGVFAGGELIKVSLDRPKRTAVAWMTWAELHEHKAVAHVADGVAHVRDLPMIAALRATWQKVCPDCRDELLVRSGEEPEQPTPYERAIDASAIADNAESRRPMYACNTHGISREALASPAIVKAVCRNAPSLGGRSIRVTFPHERGEYSWWFDQALLRYALGDGIDVSTGTYRIDNEREREQMRGLCWPVCRHCLCAWLERDFTSSAS